MQPRPLPKATATSRPDATAPLLLIGHIMWPAAGLAMWWMLTGL